MSEAQRQYLRKRAAQLRELDRCCDCPGCDYPKCKGFTRACTCDTDLEALREARTKTTPRT